MPLRRLDPAPRCLGGPQRSESSAADPERPFEDLPEFYPGPLRASQEQDPERALASPVPYINRRKNALERKDIKRTKDSPGFRSENFFLLRRTDFDDFFPILTIFWIFFPVLKIRLGSGGTRSKRVPDLPKYTSPGDGDVIFGQSRFRRVRGRARQLRQTRPEAGGPEIG